MQINQVSLEDTIKALRGGGSTAGNVMSSAAQAVQQNTAQSIEARKAALQKRIQEAGLFSQAEAGPLAQEAGVNLTPGREITSGALSDFLAMSKAKNAPKDGGVVGITKEEALEMSSTLPAAAQAQFLASAVGLSQDKAANLAARLGLGQKAIDIQGQKRDYQQETDPARLKTNMFARQAGRSNESLNEISGRYGTGLFDQIPMFEQMKTEDRKKFDQARTMFANSILRPETGAVINKSEYADLDKRYIPLPGDTREVLAAKQAAREDMVRLLNAVRGGDPEAIARLSDLPEASDNARVRAKRQKNKSPLEKVLQPQAEPVSQQEVSGVDPEDAMYFQ